MSLSLDLKAERERVAV